MLSKERVDQQGYDVNETAMHNEIRQRCKRDYPSNNSTIRRKTKPHRKRQKKKKMIVRVSPEKAALSPPFIRVLTC